MSSVEAYLDRACRDLRVDPAEAEDIRRELRAHLTERVQEAVAGGRDLAEAIEEVLAGFGPAEQVRSGLCEVHEGDPLWLYRLKGGTAGALLAAAAMLLLSVVSHAGAGPLTMPTPAAGAITGGLVGLLSRPRRELAIGSIVGALAWMVLSCASLTSGAGTEALSSGDSLPAFNSVVFAPVLGALFGATVGVGIAALLSISSRSWLQIY